MTGHVTVDHFEAVVGYDLDEEYATWGAGATANAALLDACQRFMAEQTDYIESGDYEVTVYDTPLERKRPDGDSEIFAWAGRGAATVTVGVDGRYTVGPIVWTMEAIDAEAGNG